MHVSNLILDIIQEQNHIDNGLSCGMQGPYKKMAIVVQNYVQSLINEHPYWNRSQGADHFFVNCHKIGVLATRNFPLLKNAIRVLCATWHAFEFDRSKDMFLPPPGYDFIEYRYIARILKKIKKISFFSGTHVLSMVVSFSSSSATWVFPPSWTTTPLFFFFFFFFFMPSKNLLSLLENCQTLY